MHDLDELLVSSVLLDSTRDQKLRQNFPSHK